MSVVSQILFIGVDAADKDLIFRWAETGLLPTFRSLLEKAAWGSSTNPPGLFVGAVWPSFYTGVSPARHGRYCYSQIRPGSYESFKFRLSDVKCEPFWNVLSRAGRRVAVIDVPKSVPSDNLNGIQVVDWGTHDPDFGFATVPPSLASQVEAVFGRDPVGKCDHTGRGPDEFKVLRDALVARVGKKANLAAYLLEQGGWDFFLAVFSESHCVGHQCWHLHDATHPRHDETMVRAVGDPIKDVYIAIDAAIGQLLKCVGPETIVFILASHGMGPHYDGTFLLGEILRRLENAQLSLARRRTGDFLRRCWDCTPLAVRSLLRPIRNRARKTLGQALPTTEIDGSRKCFQITNNDVYGGIRINLVGREPYGRIRPGAECDAFCEELSRDLLALINLDTAKPLVRRVLRTTDLYRGEHIDDLPDLLVEWSREAPIFSVYSPKTGTIQGEYRGTRTGDHKSEGLFFTFGPWIRPGQLEQPVSVMDFAPTVTSLLGVPLHEIDGKPIAPLIDRA